MTDGVEMRQDEESSNTPDASIRKNQRLLERRTDKEFIGKRLHTRKIRGNVVVV